MKSFLKKSWVFEYLKKKKPLHRFRAAAEGQGPKDQNGFE